MKRVTIDTSKNKIWEIDTIIDRTPIESTLYMRSYGRINNTEWKRIQTELYMYKLFEMPVHIDNL